MRRGQGAKRRKVEEDTLLMPGRVRRLPAHGPTHARMLTVAPRGVCLIQVACAMTSLRSGRRVRKESGECHMTRWAYGVQPEASSPPPLHVRCAGCGARICCGCLESCADVFETVASRNSLRRLRVLPHEFWTAWRGRAYVTKH